MLTVYSTHGSPGASTTAIYLAAQWASSGREVLLIEADPAAGSMSQKLGIQFTPGTASFIAAGGGVSSANLIEHAQDVLLSCFHVMPTPSSPSGAKSVAEKFARLGDELRDVSDNEMAVIVDAGRLTADTGASELTTSAAAVLIVSRDSSELPSLEHVSGALVSDASEPGALGLAATVGASPLSGAEWSASHGLAFVGSVELSAASGTDLSMFMARGKRKSRKLRGSLEKLADALYEFAFPGSAAAPRPRLPANRRQIDAAPAPVPEAPTAAEPGDLLAGVPPPAEPGDLLAGVPPPAEPVSLPPQPGAAAMPAPEPPPVHEMPAHEQPVYEHYGAGVPERAPLDAPPLQYSQAQPAPAAYEPPPMHAEYPAPPAAAAPAAPHGFAPHDYGGEEPPLYGLPAHAGHPSAQPADAAPPPPPAEAPVAPTGSFRTWAVHLYGEAAGDDPDEHRVLPGEGATA